MVKDAAAWVVMSLSLRPSVARAPVLLTGGDTEGIYSGEILWPEEVGVALAAVVMTGGARPESEAGDWRCQ